MAHLRQLLEALNVPDTNIVSQATTALRGELKKPETVGHLLQLLSDSNEVVRQLSAVLLRKVLPDRVRKASASDVANARAAVLSALGNETTGTVRSALIALAASVASASGAGRPDGTPWPELIKAALSNSSETSLQLLTALCDTSSMAILNEQAQLVLVLRDAFKNRSPRCVRAYAGALNAASLQRETNFESLVELVPTMVDAVQAFAHINSATDGFARIASDAFECCQVISDVGGKDNKEYFKGMVTMASDMFRYRQAASEARSAAAEYLIFAAVNKPRTMRKLESLPKIFQGVCEVASEFRIPEEDDDEDDSDNENPSDVALRVLENLSNRPEFTLLIFQAAVYSAQALLESCANEANQADRDSRSSAAFRIMASISEGCASLISEHAQDIIPKLTEGATSAALGPRARANALNAMAHVCEWLYTDEMATSLVSSIASVAINAVTNGLRDPVKQVREASCTALQPVLNLCLLEPSSLEGRFKEIISALGSLGSNAAVEAVVAVGVLAENVPDEFFALDCIPDLVRATLIQMSRMDEDSVDARVYGLETAGSLVAACKDKSVIGELAGAAILGLESDEPTVKRATFMFFAKMADAVGAPAVITYGTRVMKEALKSMEREDVEFTPEEEEGNGAFKGITEALADGDEEIANGEDDEDLGKGVFHVRTAYLDEKTTAVAVCGAFASAAACPEYVGLANQQPQVAREIQELLGKAVENVDQTVNYFHEEVRASSQKAGVRYAIANVTLSKIAPQLMFAGTEFVSQTFQRLSYGLTDDEDTWAVASTLSSAVVLCDELEPSVVGEFKQILIDGLKVLIRGNGTCQESYDDPEEEGEVDDGEVGEDVSGVAEGVCDLYEALARNQRGFFAADAAEIFKDMITHMFNATPRNRGLIFGAVSGVILYLSWDRCTTVEIPPPGDHKHELALQVIDILAAQLLPSALEALTDGKGMTLTRNAVFVTGVIFQRARAGNKNVWNLLGKAAELLGMIMSTKTPDTAALVDNAAGAVSRIVTSPGFQDTGPLGNHKVVLEKLVSVIPMMGDPQENTTVARAILKIAELDAEAVMLHVNPVVSSLASATLLAVEQRKQQQKRRAIGERKETDENDPMTKLTDEECNCVVQLLAQLQRKFGDAPFGKLNLKPEDTAALTEVLGPHLQ